ncbi:MAG: growth inhibitor PemK [Janthinobacterium lividum]
MSLPTPEAGLVIPYNYLWRSEHRKGQDEGRKTRPTVIVLVVRKVEGNAPRVTVAPITHTPPDAKTEAIELPPRVKHALQLDGERSWIILDEVNEFTWPGYDIRPVPGSESFSYGFIPPKLYDAVIARLLDLATTRRVTEIRRD